MTRGSCPVCGQEVEIQGTIAGTNFYIGLDEQEVEQLQAENAVLKRALAKANAAWAELCAKMKSAGLPWFEHFEGTFESMARQKLAKEAKDA